jgi:hypothetical protein
VNARILNALLNDLQGRELLAFFNPVRAETSREGTRLFSGELARQGRRDFDDSLPAYLEDFAKNNFSVLFNDGSLAQIDVFLKGNDIVRHRYCYIPAPFDVSQDISPDQLYDYISTVTFDIADIRLRSRVRFDFIEEDNDTHPRSHVTMVNDDCRIAARNGLGVRSFLRFVYRNFLTTPRAPEAVAMLANDYVAGLGPHERWRTDPHLTWA